MPIAVGVVNCGKYLLAIPTPLVPQSVPHVAKPPRPWGSKCVVHSLPADCTTFFCGEIILRQVSYEAKQISDLGWCQAVKKSGRHS